MVDHPVDSCLFMVYTIDLFMEILVDKICSATVERTTILKRGPLEMDRKMSI